MGGKLDSLLRLSDQAAELNEKLYGKKSDREISLDPEVKDYILAGVLEGKSITQICREFNEEFYSGKNELNRVKILLWLHNNKDDTFTSQYWAAREIGGNFILDEIIDIEEKVINGDIGHKSANFLLSSKKFRAVVQNPGRYNPVMKSEHRKTVEVVIRSALPEPLPTLEPVQEAEIIITNGVTGPDTSDPP